MSEYVVINQNLRTLWNQCPLSGTSS